MAPADHRELVCVLGPGRSGTSVTAYSGTDAGTLVLSLGEPSGAGYNSYAIFLRRFDGKYDQRVWSGPGNTKSGGSTPTTVNGLPSSVMDCPMIVGFPPNRWRHSQSVTGQLSRLTGLRSPVPGVHSSCRALTGWPRGG